MDSLVSSIVLFNLGSSGNSNKTVSADSDRKWLFPPTCNSFLGVSGVLENCFPFQPLSSGLPSGLIPRNDPSSLNAIAHFTDLATKHGSSPKPLRSAYLTKCSSMMASCDVAFLNRGIVFNRDHAAFHFWTEQRDKGFGITIVASI